MLWSDKECFHKVEYVSMEEEVNHAKKRPQFLNIQEHHMGDDEVETSRCFFPLRSISSGSRSTGSPPYSFGKMKRKIHASAVSTASIYKQNTQQKSWKWRLLRRSFGVPIAVIYYFLLVWILSNFILDKSGNQFLQEGFNVSSVTGDICDVIFGRHRNTAKTNQTEDSIVGKVTSHMEDYINC